MNLAFCDSTTKVEPSVRQQTKQEKLEEYHSRGEFTGYTTPQELERDMESLAKTGSTQATSVLQELRKCK